MTLRFRIPNPNLPPINGRDFRPIPQPDNDPGLGWLPPGNDPGLGWMPPVPPANGPGLGFLPPDNGPGLGFLPPDNGPGLGFLPPDNNPGFGFPPPPLGIGDIIPIPGITRGNRNSSDKKRKITVSQNNLDPLASYNFSREKYGDRNGIRYERPLNNSPHLRASLRDNFAEPNVSWSLARFGNGQDAPVRASSTSLSSFLAAIDPNVFLQGDHYRSLFNRGNPYVYVEKPLEGSQEQYRSMPAEMLGAMFDTTERILQALSLFNINGIVGHLQRELKETAIRYVVVLDVPNPGARAISDPEVQFFFDRLVTLGAFNRFFNGGSFVQRVSEFKRDLRARVLETRSDITLFQIVTELLNNIAIDQTSRDNEKKLNRYIIVEAFRPVVSIQTLIISMQQQNLYQYSYRYVEIDTPYITNRNTFEYLNQRADTGFQAKAESNYNFYAKDYENIAEDSYETLLPNIYAVNKYAELASSLARTEGQQEKLTELTTYLSLGETFDNLSDLGTFSRERFYNLYSRSLENFDDSTAQIWTAKNSSIILESSQMGDPPIKFNNSPMSIGLQFYRDDPDNFEALLTGQEFQLDDFRETMFENINKMASGQNRSLALYSTEYLQANLGLITEKESAYIETSLRQIPFADLLTPQYYGQSDSQIVTNSEFQSLVIDDSALNVSTADDLGVLEELLHNKAESTSRNSYPSILDVKDTPSDALGYRISKKINNLEIQNFYIGNGTGPRSITYMDSQVKYGNDYSYDLYEYRLLYGSDYSFDVLGKDTPIWLLRYYLGLLRTPTQQMLAQSPNVSFDCWVDTTPNYDVLEIPIYVEEFKESTINLLLSDQEIINLGSITYPLTKVLDYPPTAPILNIFPLVGNDSQIKINANLQTGQSLGDQAEKIISIGDLSDRIILLKEYQDNFKNIFLPPDKLEYKNEGLTEIKNILLYRTTNIDLDVEEYNQLYQSFNPITNPDVFVRSYSDNESLLESSDIPVLSYDVLENIEPNINYYYTCIVQDVHENPSNPSIIYRVRLLLDKGLLIPEIELVKPIGSNKQMPEKNLSRYLKIEASDIQTFPFTETTGDTVGSERSLGNFLGKPIEDQSYIVRFTSKDTGRKFDLKLNFVIQVNGAPINVGT